MRYKIPCQTSSVDKGVYYITDQHEKQGGSFMMPDRKVEQEQTEDRCIFPNNYFSSFFLSLLFMCFLLSLASSDIPMCHCYG